MAGLGGFARVDSRDPRERRNAARLSSRFSALNLSPPLGLDADGKFAINLGDGVTLVGSDLALNLGNGVEFVSGAVTATEGANVLVDADGINALPTAAWFFANTSDRPAEELVRDAENRGQLAAWFWSN